MLTNGATAGSSLKIFQHLQQCCVRSLRRGKAEGWQRRFGTSSPGPPWRILFFGSDEFAVESLKLLSSNRCKAYCKQMNLHWTELYIRLCWNVEWEKQQSPNQLWAVKTWTGERWGCHVEMLSEKKNTTLLIQTFYVRYWPMMAFEKNVCHHGRQKGHFCAVHYSNVNLSSWVSKVASWSRNFVRIYIFVNCIKI